MIARSALPAVLLAALLGPPPVAAARPRILPPPLESRETAGRFVLPDTLTLALIGSREEDRFAARVLASELAAWGRTRVGITSSGDGDIVLGARPASSDLGDEGYELSVTPTRIAVRASSAAGVFHGVQTLRQAIERTGVPCMEVRDRPALAWRGVLEDLSRGPVPTVDALEERIEMLAELKLNLYAIYLENVVDYPGHALVTRRGGSLSLADLQHLGEHAQRHHVTLMPIQQTLGHMGAWLAHERYRPLAAAPGGQTLAPDAPATDAFLAPLLRQLAAHTPGPFVHIGADEADLTSASPPTAGAGVSGASLTGFVRRQHGVLAAAGKRTMVWGDGLLAADAPIASLPAEVVVATWKYELADDYGPQIEPFRRARRPFIVCPGAWNWRRVFPDVASSIANIRRFTQQGRAAGAIGQMTCTWGDGGEALFDLTWYPVAAGAMAAWSESGPDTAALRRDFDWWWLRADGTNAAQAVAHLAQVNPITWRGTRLLAEPLFTWLDPAHPVNRGVLANLAGEAPALRREIEQAIECVARARARAGRRADRLDALEFAGHRILGIADRATSTQQARADYLEAQRASQPGGDRERAGQKLDAVRDLQARNLDRLIETRDAFTRLWDRDHQIAGRSRVLAQYDRDIARWTDRLELFRMLRLLVVNGRPLPPAQDVGFDP